MSAPGRLENYPHVVIREVREIRCIGEFRYNVLNPRSGEPPPPIPRPLLDRLPPPPLRSQSPSPEPDLGDYATQEFQIWVDYDRTPSPEPRIPAFPPADLPLFPPADLPPRPTRPTPGAPVVTPDPPIAPYNPWDPELMDPRPAHGALQRGAQLIQNRCKTC